MATDDEVKQIIKDIGEDVKKLREHLTGASRALIKNTQSKLAEQKVVKELIKQNEKLRKSLKDNNLLTEERNKTIDKNIKVIKEHSQATKSATKGWFNWKTALMGVIKWLGKVVKAGVETGVEFAKTSGNIKTFSDLIAAGAEDIPGLGKVLKAFGVELDGRTQMFKGLAQSGATFGSSITTLGNYAYEAGMPLVQFQELIQNNTTTMARLFGTVNEGIPEIAGLGRALKKFTMDELSGFGITMDQTNEFLTTYAEIERARGRAGQLTQQSLLEGTKAYAKNLTTLSRLTGESVDAIDKRNRGIAADGVFQAKLAQMDEDQQQRVYAAMKLLPEAAQQAAKEMIGMGVPIGDAAKGLEVFSGGKFGNALLAFTRATGKFTDNDLVALSNEFKTMGTGVVRSGDAMASAAFVGNNMATEAANIFSAMAGDAADAREFAKQSVASLDNNTNSLVAVDDQLGLVHAELQKFNTHLLDGLVINEDSLFGDALKSFTDGNVKWSKELKETLIKTTDKLMGWVGGKSNFQMEGNARGWDNVTAESYGYGKKSEITSGGWRNYADSYKNLKPQIKEKALGGSMNAGQLTLVGEKGPELISSKTQSTVTANQDLAKLFNTQILENKMTTMVSELNNANKNLSNMVSSVNTLVAIGAMTEKNTKSTHKGLAELSGTLV